MDRPPIPPYIILGSQAAVNGSRLPSSPNARQTATRKKYKPTVKTDAQIAIMTPHQSFPVCTKLRQNAIPVSPKIKQARGTLNFM